MKKRLLLTTAFLLAVVISFYIGRLSNLGWSTIQILSTKDRSHTAELRRLYYYIDVNFRIVLDGKIIYRSPDFTPYDDRPFREWITWDESGKHLVFIVADQILFAYDIETDSPLSPDSFPSLKIPRYSLADIGYEGDYPGRPPARTPATHHQESIR